MSYDIDLIDPSTNEPVILTEVHAFRGGTMALGGCPTASHNITYNYSKFYRDCINEEEGIRWIYGKTGREVLPVLIEAVLTLGCDVDEDYWKATPGNAGDALRALIFFALELPDGIFRGD